MIKYRSYAHQWGRSKILILADPSESHEVEKPQFPPKMCFYWNKGGKEARQNKIVHSIGTDFQTQYTKQLVNYCFELYTLKMWINLSTNKFRWYSLSTTFPLCSKKCVYDLWSYSPFQLPLNVFFSSLHPLFMDWFPPRLPLYTLFWTVFISSAVSIFTSYNMNSQMTHFLMLNGYWAAPANNFTNISNLGCPIPNSLPLPLKVYPSSYVLYLS